ncbi:MAG: DNA methyltransferase, partial [bacterium]
MDKQIEFYKHDVNWANRLILGDSLLVMNSLLVKEGMAGKVQMIYVDPPYGIKYSSNFQPRIDRRDVKDKDEDLTHEPEQIKAYRDTWKLGIHSYLTYLRDRLLLCRELLCDSGSIFVQINDENLHLVRCLLDEIFGRENFVAVIAFRTHSPLSVKFLPNLFDYLLWYAKDKPLMKFRPLFLEKTVGERTQFTFFESCDGTRRPMTKQELRGITSLPTKGKIYRLVNLPSSGYTPSCTFEFEFQGTIFKPSRGRSWKTTLEGMFRLTHAERIIATGSYLNYIYFWDDFKAMQLPNIWDDVYTELDKRYTVQTSVKVVERCIL